MKYTVDRIECGIAVCEDEELKTVQFKIEVLPMGIGEGDIFEEADGGFVFLKDETEARQKRIAERKKRMFEKKK